MDWINLKIAIGGDYFDAFSDWLNAQGAVAVTAAEAGGAVDAGDQPLLEPAPDAMPLWSDIEVDALFPADADVETLRREIAQWCCANELAEPVVHVEPVADRDWSVTWREGLAPLGFGPRGEAPRLWVVPREWADDVPGTTVLRLDPGLAFGSGTHATTALCLQWLVERDLAGWRVVDFGCGSGILAIAALLLGAAEAVAVDHDPQALTATQDNALFNGIDPARLPIIDPDSAGAYTDRDLVVANILARPLIELAPELSRLIKPGGWLLMSGLLAHQADAVAEAYPAFVFDPPEAELSPLTVPEQMPGHIPEPREGWVYLAGRKTGG